MSDAYQGNPEFPTEAPQVITAGNSSNDTDILYILDPDGQAVTITSVNDEDGNAITDFAGVVINTPKYGRFKQVVVGAPTRCTLIATLTL